MIKKNILIVTTYPIKNAQHGGQKRTRAIYEAYRAKFSNVKFVAVYFRGYYPVAATTDIAVGPIGEARVQGSPWTGDIIVSEAIMSDPTVKQKMTEMLREFRPDIIHIEQVYPYMGLKALLAELKLSPKLVFGSQNVEYGMKEEILLGAGVEPDKAKAVADQIYEWEVELARDCDLLAAVTKADLKEHEDMGATKSVLAPNGIDRVVASDSALAHWKHYFEQRGIKRTILFVGSAHPPNWAGFETMIGSRLGFLALDTRLILAGSISDYFQREYTKERLDHVTFWQRAVAAGRVSDDSLAALLQMADVIALPITEGGGSNLKTAEAILSGKKLVATDHAFRSYEQYLDLPNIWRTNDPDKFRHYLLEALEAPYQQRTTEEEKLAGKVSWSHVMTNLVEEVAAL